MKVPGTHREWDEVYEIRNVIRGEVFALPEYQTRISHISITKLIDVPPHEAIEKVKHRVIQKLAYSEWERAGCPCGMDSVFWSLGERKFNDAFYWWI